MTKKLTRIALLGNPNVGKSSLFNALTGLDQKVGNFPGVTVDRKTGHCQPSPQHKIEVIDLPGLYSLFAKSPDERVVLDVLLDQQNPEYPELVVVILDALNIERSLLLYTQVQDLGFEVLPVLNLVDVAQAQGQSIDTVALSRNLQKEVIAINARSESGVETLKKTLADYALSAAKTQHSSDFWQKIQQTHSNATPLEHTDLQLNDTVERLTRVHNLLAGVVQNQPRPRRSFTDRLDRIATHPILGYLLYFGILFLIFQFLFSVAEYPMTWIEDGFGALGDWVSGVLPEGAINDLITNGIIAGICGVVVFIPQIAFLFGFIAILEESGYMSRVVFLMDRPMRLFGLSGKSVVPLLSGAACAVPAVMSARNIEHPRERLATIFVTPFISCSARLPVYIIIIGLVIPDQTIWGIFSLQALTMLVLYLLGIVAALLTALVFRLLDKARQRMLFVIDMPLYKSPRWKNVLLTIWQKTKTFVLEAGKIILAISIILWALASYGPPQAMQAAEQKAKEMAAQTPDANYDNILAAQQLEASYIGHLGHFIEPAIRPLGYDWKIGIALITSFAAREVFVGTLATIYSVGEDDGMEERLSEKMRLATFSDTGKPVYTLASGISLLLFYVFAMQCMSTLAIVRRETGTWRWAMLQLLYMSALAYLSALLSFWALG